MQMTDRWNIGRPVAHNLANAGLGRTHAFLNMGTLQGNITQMVVDLRNQQHDHAMSNTKVAQIQAVVNTNHSAIAPVFNQIQSAQATVRGLMRELNQTRSHSNGWMRLANQTIARFDELQKYATDLQDHAISLRRQNGVTMIALNRSLTNPKAHAVLRQAVLDRGKHSNQLKSK